MAIRFQSIFPTERGVTVTINIHDTEYVGDPIAFNTDSTGYKVSYAQTGGEQIQQFMSTQCEIIFYIEDETQFELITDFSNAQEGRFYVSVKEDGNLHWTGVVLPDVTTYEEIDFPIRFTIKATDGVGALKDVPFKASGGDFYTGKATLAQFICRALSRIVYVPEFYGSINTFLRSSVDWWEEHMDHDGAGPDMLDQAYVDNAVYYTYKDGVQGVLSCYDVLKDILTSNGMRLTYARGAFHLEQLPYRIADIVVQRVYDMDGVFHAANNYNSPNDIDQTSAGALLATAEYEFTAPISRAEHRFAALERRNFFAGLPAINESNSSLYTFNVPIHAAGGDTTLRLTGSFVLRISSNISAPGYTNPLNPFVAVIRLNFTLTDPNESLQRTYTLLPTYQYVYAQITWNPTPGFYILQPIGGIFSQNTTADYYTFTQQLDIITPPLPGNTDSFSLSCTLESLKYYDGTTVPNWATDFEVLFDLSNPWLEAYTNGGPVLSGDGNVFYTDNTETQNTVVWKTEGLIGSSFNPNTVGAIWVKPASTYILAEHWGAGAETPAYSFIGQMLTRDIALTHAKPARKLNGTLYGDIISLSRVVWQSENWILLGGTWNATNNLFSGTWLEMKAVEGLTPSNPIKFAVYPDPNPPTTQTDTPGFDGPFRIAAPHGSVWYAIASTLTNDNLRAGTPGTIDIQDILSDYDFNAGDTIAIINPLTGAFETLDITTTTSNGETALVVSGSLLNDYPIGSPIVRIPRIGGPFTLPGGIAGQIMRHNGTKWTAYGTSALTDGHILTWTDAGGWAAAAPATSGTVTSVALALPTSVFDISGSPVTGSGTLTATFDTQTANTVFAGPTTGGAATPAFRALVAADIPATLTGVVGQIAYFNTSTTITTEAGSGVNSLAWDATNNKFDIGGGFVFNASTRIANFGIVGGNPASLIIENNTSGSRGLKIGSLEFGSYNTNNCWFGDNMYWAPGFTHNATGPASLFYFINGGFQYRTAPSASAGAAATQTTVFQITNTGQATFGATSSGARLSVLGAGLTSSTITAQFHNANGNNNALVILDNGNSGFGTASPQQKLHVQGTARITGSDGTATTIMGRDADGDISNLGLSGLSIVAGTLTNSNTGTVTSVALTMPTGFSVSGSPVTSSGTLAVSTTLNGNLRGNGSGFVVGSVALGSEVSGILPIANGGTNLSALGTALQLLRVNAGATALEYFTATYLTANQTITLSGDVSGSGTTAITTTIGANKVTLAMMAQIITASFLGRNTGGTGNVEVLSVATVKTMLGLTGTNSGDQTITLTGDVTGSGTGSFAATIANNAVTVAKMAQLAGLSILARSANSTGNVAALTASVALSYLRLNAAGTALEFGVLPSGITGTGVANQVSYWTGTSTQGGGVNFLIDPTNTRLQLNAAGSPITSTARLDVRMGSVTGTDELFRYSGNVSTGVLGAITNSRNASGTGDAYYIAQVGGTSAGDAFYQAIVLGGKTWSFGVDNSDSDKWKLRPQTSLGAGATGGEGLTITSDVTPLIGVNTDSPIHPLDVNGIARALTWTNRTDANSPTATLGAGAGSATGGTVDTVVYPNGNMGTVKFTTGTVPIINGTIVTIVPPTAVRHANKIYPVFSACNAATATDISKIYVDLATSTPGSLVFKASGTLTPSTQYFISFVIMGHA